MLCSISLELVLWVYAYIRKGSLVVQIVKKLPAMWHTWAQFLGLEYSLERELVTHSNILAWKIPWTKEPCGLQSTGSQRVGHDWVTNIHISKLKNTNIKYVQFLYISCFSVAQSCLTLCDPMDCSMSAFPLLHHFLEFAQTHVHWVDDAIQSSHLLLPPSPLAFNLS